VNLQTIADAHKEVALSSALRSPNLLLIGSEAAICEFLTPLMASCAAPVVCCDGATPEFPNVPVGSLIVRDVARLTRASQQRLLDWMNDLSPGARVIATSGRSLFPSVERGLFSDGLYYRINTLTLMLNRETDAPGLGQVRNSPESEPFLGTTL
jgi:Sigma-54 interaction domain